MLGIIGGTGIYDLDGLSDVIETVLDTPFGQSAHIRRARSNTREFLFLSRHGSGHALLPHEINYRANIFALKALGATQIVSLSAVGSLRESIRPGDLVIPSQYLDWVRGDRARTFFGKGVAAHVSTAEPVCASLTQWIARAGDTLGFPIRTGVTYACVDGPRLGTRAESNFLRLAGCDVVGMTNVPEAFLAREAQLCYASLGIVTDYDCWMEDREQHVTVSAVIARYGASLAKARQLVARLLESELPQEDHCRVSLTDAVLTPQDAMTAENAQMLEVLKR